MQVDFGDLDITSPSLDDVFAHLTLTGARHDRPHDHHRVRDDSDDRRADATGTAMQLAALVRRNLRPRLACRNS